MAFLFGKSKKQQQGLPTSGRNLTSADGSSIPTGANSVAVKDGEKPRMGGQSSMAPPMNPGMIARGATPDQMALQQVCLVIRDSRGSCRIQLLACRIHSLASASYSPMDSS